MSVNDVVIIITALSTLLTALGGFLLVLPKLGVHNAKLDALTKDVAAVAAVTTNAAIAAGSLNTQPTTANVAPQLTIVQPVPGPNPPSA